MRHECERAGARQLSGMLIFAYTQVCSSFPSHGLSAVGAHLDSSLPSGDDANDPVMTDPTVKPVKH